LALQFAAGTGPSAHAFAFTAGATNLVSSTKPWHFTAGWNPALTNIAQPVAAEPAPAAQGADPSQSPGNFDVYVVTNLVAFFDNATQTLTNIVQITTNYVPRTRPVVATSTLEPARIAAATNAVAVDSNSAASAALLPITTNQAPIEVDSSLRLILGGRTNLAVPDGRGGERTLQFTGRGITNVAPPDRDPLLSQLNRATNPAPELTVATIDTALAAHDPLPLPARVSGWGLLLVASTPPPIEIQSRNEYSGPTLLTNRAAPIPAWFSQLPEPPPATNP
jgi:hypothetical protein